MSEPGVSDLRIDRANRAPTASRWAWLFGLLAFALAASTSYLGYRLWRAEETAAPVRTATVRLAGEARKVVLSARGYIEADRRSEVGAEVFGVVKAVHYREGDRVPAGRVIAELKNDLLSAKKAEQAVNLKYALEERKRQEKLWVQKAAPEKAVQEARRAVEIAERRLEQAEAIYQQTLIRAPFAGIVTAVHVRVGNAVGAAPGVERAGPLVTLVDFDSLVVIADLDQADLPKLAKVDDVEIDVEGIPVSYRGKVLRVLPQAHRSKGAVQVKIAIEGKDARLLPNMSARVRLMRKGGRRPVYPEEASRDGHVLILRGGYARRVPVSSLQGGEEVLLRPEAALDGRPVRRIE